MLLCRMGEQEPNAKSHNSFSRIIRTQEAASFRRSWWWRRSRLPTKSLQCSLWSSHRTLPMLKLRRVNLLWARNRAFLVFHPWNPRKNQVCCLLFSPHLIRRLIRLYCPRNCHHSILRAFRRSCRLNLPLALLKGPKCLRSNPNHSCPSHLAEQRVQRARHKVEHRQQDLLVSR